VCGDLLICIPLFIESVFQVPLKKEKKKERRKEKGKETKGADSLRCFFRSVLGGAL
jgi:hypothetical protein